MTNCALARDLLALYHEGLVSEETAQWMEAHLAECPTCTQHLATLRQDVPAQPEDSVVPLQRVARAIRRRRYLTALLAALLMLSLAIIVGNVLTTPQYIGARDAIEVTAREDEIWVSFADEVTNYSVNPLMPGRDYYLEIWSTHWDRMIHKDAPSDLVLARDQVAILYLKGDDSEPLIPLVGGREEGVGVLPDLALAYYVLLALLIMVIATIVALIVRKRAPRLAQAALLVATLAFSHNLATFLITGFTTSTHHIIRDLLLIVLLTPCLFGVLVLGFTKIRARRTSVTPPRQRSASR